MLIFSPDTEAVKKTVIITPDHRGQLLHPLGALAGDESITMQVPTVQEPVEATDAHWATMVKGGADVALTATTNALTVVGSGRVRFVKTATAAAVGLRLGI